MRKTVSLTAPLLGAALLLSTLGSAGLAAATADVDQKAEIDALYATLEKERAALRRRLDRLRYEINNRDLPRDLARDAVSRVSGGYFLLKNPPLRAAFSSLEEVRKELEQVRRARRRLDSLEGLLTKDDTATTQGNDQKSH